MDPSDDEDVIFPEDGDLIDAVYEGDLEKVKKLLDEGEDINARDDYGRTPLHYAAPKGYLDVVKFLVEKGADINAKNKDGKAPLDLVMDIVDFLEMVGKVTAEIIDVKHSPLYEGFWGRILISTEGEGTVKVDLEGDVDWIDPGEIIINGEDEVEIPVKPKIHGEVPVKITVKGGEKSTSKIVWLNVASIQEVESTAEKSRVKLSELQERKAKVKLTGNWIEEEIERIKGFLMEIKES